jgi:hypothetical protein
VAGDETAEWREIIRPSGGREVIRENSGYKHIHINVHDQVRDEMGEWRHVMGEDCGRLAETIAAIERIEALVLEVCIHICMCGFLFLAESIYLFLSLLKYLSICSCCGFIHASTEPATLQASLCIYLCMWVCM